MEHLTLTFYQDHIEHQVIAGSCRQILASHQVTLEIKEIGYDQWRRRSRAISGLTAPTLRYRWIFAVRALVQVPLLQHCIPIDWQADAAAGAMAK